VAAKPLNGRLDLLTEAVDQFADELFTNSTAPPPTEACHAGGP